MSVPTPRVQLFYGKKDITADVSESLIEVSYTDYLEGESDSVEVTLEDVQRRWQGTWYPQHGDSLSLLLGYVGAPLLPCGDFEIDEIQLSGPPDVVRIKALAAGVKRSVRTRNGRAYEATTLADIARAIARRNRLTLHGTIARIRIARVTQVYETDLTFLRRLAEEYGYSFSVRGSKLTFFARAATQAAPALLTLTRTDVTRFDFRDKIHGVALAAEVSYHDPRSKTTRRARAQDAAAPRNRRSADTLKVQVRAESNAQARLKAKAALNLANEDQTGASLVLPGNTRLMAGLNVNLAGFGHLDGKYNITQSRHAIAHTSGYTTDIELKRVRQL